MSKNRRQSDRPHQQRPVPPRVSQRAPRQAGARRPGPSPTASPSWRHRLERTSYPILLWLTQLPKWVLGVVTAGVLLGGLMAPAPWAPVLLGLVAAFVTWLLILAWPRLDATPRLLRCTVVAALIAIIVAQSVGAV